MRRLYLQIYFTVVLSLVLFTIVAVFLWRQVAETSAQRQPLDVVANLVQSSCFCPSLFSLNFQMPPFFSSSGQGS